jgi:SRSO17 transposase
MLRYVRGLSAPVLRKNAWTLANLAGSSSPDSMQRLLRTSEWDISGVRDDLRAEVVARLGGDQRLWILDETAFRKRGSASVGVDRQYMRTARRLENCQIGVFLLYATSRGQGLVDRELYLPTTWIDSPDRRHRARVPDEFAHVSRAGLGQRMLERAYEAGLLDGWVTADKSYGSTPALRSWLVDRMIPSVLATNNDDMVGLAEDEAVPADVIVQGVLAGEVSTVDGWRSVPIQAGPYAGEVFDWAAVELGRKGLPTGWAQWLLVRRQLTPTQGTHHLKTACYRCVGPGQTPMATMIQIAGARWRSELCFERARSEFGMDQYQVRDWRGWYAHVTLSMVAAALGLPSDLTAGGSG